jgi:putative ABC transport system ATP-binding protein
MPEPPGGPPLVPRAAAETSAAAPLIRLDGLSKSYREGETEHAVLRSASATIGRGEFVVLLGPSGSGKSTLLNLIGGIDRPDAGRVLIDGVELTALSERDRTLFRRRHIGFIFQFFNLIPTLSVADNLLLPLGLAGRIQRGDRQRAAALLEQVGLADRAGAAPDRLSGGEQQRVAIARALIHNPLLVLADEPTGNLDAATGDRVLALLDALTRQTGRTLVMVTHAREIAARADRVLALVDGEVIEQPRVGGAPPPAAGAAG